MKGPSPGLLKWRQVKSSAISPHTRILRMPHLQASPTQTTHTVHNEAYFTARNRGKHRHQETPSSAQSGNGVT